MNSNISSIQIGSITISVAEHKLTNSQGVSSTLQPKIVDVLSFLADNYPRLMSRSELIDSIWDGNYYVGEKALTNSIWHLRQTFTKLAPEEEVIETIRKSGYKLLIEPEIESVDNEIEQLKNTKPLNSSPLNRLNIIYTIFAVFIFAVFYWLFSINEQVKNYKPEITNITTEPGREVFPAVSPNGRYLAYKRVQQGKHVDLYIKDLTLKGAPARQITFDDKVESGPIWSKDGKSLYFAQRHLESIKCYLVELKLSHNQFKKLAPCPSSGFTQASLSPSGNTIAYIGNSKENIKPAIYLYDLDDEFAVPRRLTCDPECDYYDRDISFSPDGKKLAIARRSDDSHENIFIIDIASKKETQLTNHYKDIIGLDWHPDGKRIVFGTQNAELREGFIIEVKSGKLQNLDTPGFGFPRFSDSGELYYHHRFEKYQVSAVDIANSKAAKSFPVVLSSFSHKSPDYSDINDKLVYVSNVSGFYELWLANKDGTQRQQLTFLETEISFPAWSHNGKKIAFLAPKIDGFGDQINIIEIETGKIDKIFSEYTSLSRPSWSIDDQFVYSAVFRTGDVNIFSFQVGSRVSTQITKDNGRFALAYDEKKLFYSKFTGTLWSHIKGEEMNETEILKKSDFGVRYHWDLTEKGIYYYWHDKHNHQISFYNFQDKTTQSLIEFPWLSDDQYGSLSVSMKNKLLFLTVSEYPQADIKLLEHSLLK